MPATVVDRLDTLNRDYEALHTAKEDAFWAAYMGLAQDAATGRAAYDSAEIRLKRFLQDPARLDAVRAERARAEAEGAAEEDRLALAGWEATFAAQVIPDAKARALFERLVEAEGALAQARGAMELGFRDAQGRLQRASSVKLGAMVSTDTDEARRRAAWEGLSSIEGHVLDHGFLEIVKLRNRLGRMLGGEDFYDWTVRRTEGVSKRQIFAWLDELEVATRAAGRRAVDELARKHGAPPTPWNLRFWSTGDVSREQDPYFGFGPALLRWGRSFAALGIRYRGAQLVLDLVDRKGKHENGFMHGPVPAWRRHGTHRPARIQFTANAIPGMVGAGRRAAETLFHEGGHAAHFANIDMPAPCFAQEFAPTSVAFAETQSMFLDSLLGDADWQARYATDRAGEPMPQALLEAGLAASQPMAAWELRQRLSVCYGEKALYEIPDDELNPERALAELRKVEQRLLFLDGGSPRPILAVPHLLTQDASAYYHGYVLAEMAVEQTRAFFLARDGHLTDNPKIGPTLAEHYWQPGNSRSFARFVQDLTGRPFSGRHLAEVANRGVDATIAEGRAAIARLSSVPRLQRRVQLDATIRLVHGHETIASTDGGDFERAAREFERWIDAAAAASAQHPT